MSFHRKLLQTQPTGEGAWTLTNASLGAGVYTFNSGISAISAVNGAFFKPDGTKLYIVSGNTKTVREYDLSTAWDITSASYLRDFSVSANSLLPQDLFFKPDGTKMYIVDSNTNTVYEYFLSTAWNVTTASYLREKSIATEDTNPQGLFFSTDGTNMYVVGITNDTVYQYSLSNPWVVTTASLLTSFSIAIQESSAGALFFKPDGTKMYVVGSGNDAVVEYNLSTAWLVSTASLTGKAYVGTIAINPTHVCFKSDGTEMYVSYGSTMYTYFVPVAWSVAVTTFSVASEDTAPQGLFFKPDGLKMYIVGDTGNAVDEYDLSTAWDITSASYLQNFSVGFQETFPFGLFFKSDGTKMYIVGGIGDDVNEYDLSTAWDVSTASYLQRFAPDPPTGNLESVFFKSDGTNMYLLGDSAVYEYVLSTAWDVSTSSFTSSASIALLGLGPSGLSFKSDGTKMYIVGNLDDVVVEFTLSTAWDISTVTTDYTNSYSLLSSGTIPESIFFHPDGTKMYILDSNTDSVNEYVLPTAWVLVTDRPTPNYPTSSYLDVSIVENNPNALFFKPDGTKLYVLGSATDTVYEYDLSPAWAITTASLLQGFSITAQVNNPKSLFFKPDGSKMYAVTDSVDTVNEYDLSVSWDVSTISFLQAFSVATQEPFLEGLFFRDDGLKMYIVGSSSDRVWEYDLSTAWDISTASVLQSRFVSGQDATAQSIFFKPDGTKMFVLGGTLDRANEYDLSTAWDISTASFLQYTDILLETVPRSLFFKPDGNKMYIAGQTSKAIWVYDL